MAINFKKLHLAFAGSLILIVTVSCDKNSNTTSEADKYTTVTPEKVNTSTDPSTQGAGETESAQAGGSEESGNEDMQSRIQFAGLSAPVPDTWVSEIPTSPMRAIQMKVPGVEGYGDAGLVVFVGISGSVQNNIARWLGQFTNADGSPVTYGLSEQTVGDLNISTVTISGNYNGGMNAQDAADNTQMVQSIVQHASGNQVFIKLLGPKATVEANREAFDAFLAGLK